MRRSAVGLTAGGLLALVMGCATGDMGEASKGLPAADTEEDSDAAPDGPGAEGAGDPGDDDDAETTGDDDDDAPGDDDDDDDAPDVDAGIITYRVASSTEESKIEIETLFNPQIVPR